MYYWEVAIKNICSLSCVRLKGSRKLTDYGQVFVIGSDNVPTNPMRVSNAFACDLANGSRVGSRLRDTCDYG